MKKLFFILITFFTISCTKEEPMVYEDIMGTYQYTHETYGKLEFEIAKEEQRFVLFSIPSENQTYRLINGYDFVVESSFVSLSFHHDQFYLFRDLFSHGLILEHSVLGPAVHKGVVITDTPTSSPARSLFS